MMLNHHGRRVDQALLKFEDICRREVLSMVSIGLLFICLAITASQMLHLYHHPFLHHAQHRHWHG